MCAYLVGSKIVSGVSLIGMTAVQGTHLTHGKAICGECLDSMWKPSDLYLAHSMIGMVSVTAWTSGRLAGGDSACMGRTLRSVCRSWLVCIASVACRYEGKP